jgi:hypothetical protein
MSIWLFVVFVCRICLSYLFACVCVCVCACVCCLFVNLTDVLSLLDIPRFHRVSAKHI